MFRASIFTAFLLVVSAVVRWEKRTLQCDIDICKLAVRNDTFKSADCTIHADSHHSCNIECDGADRDSVISKSPTTNRECIRFHTYNTQRVADGWQMWRTGACAKERIVLQVHCGFLVND
ncbi:hypothetical protein RB195_003671 [Necator americanus]|uniref:DUF7808 domain-containing protein n=1 Tax=Necator americanus TaxID=51031 RepID=A0ABR1DQ63_NECAM